MRQKIDNEHHRSGNRTQPSQGPRSAMTEGMQYREFGKLDWRVSALGFGCMRLPTTDGKPLSKKINEKEATRMIRHAIDKGVNYIDTAYPYHGGKSEVLVGKILTDGYREKVKLATKSPVWLIKKGKDFDTYLDEQLKRLKMDYVDFYLFHALDRKAWRSTILKHNIIERAESALEDGRIRHLGFSFHDEFSAFKEIVDGYDGWTFCQIQYNYMDVKNQAGTKGLKYAASKGLAVVVMEPLLGGRLASPPRPVRSILGSGRRKVPPVDMALQWIWNQPEVSVVLSGMSTMGQVKGNLRSASSSGIGSLGARDLKLVDRVRKKYDELIPIRCTKCGYCMPCPNGVNIPRNFEVYNDGYIYNSMNLARTTYERFIPKDKRASACIQCRKCEKKCPQGLKISELMPVVHAALRKYAKGRPRSAAR